MTTVRVNHHSFFIPPNYEHTQNISGCVVESSEEKKEMDTFLEVTRDCKCLFDVGSALGVFSLLFANSYREAFAFEPSHIQQPHFTQIYLANRDKRIYPQKMLLGDQTAIVPFHSSDFHALSLPGQDHILMMKIDDFCGMNTIRLDCIKIDVEGFELKVLAGATKAIELFRPILFVEGHNKFLSLYGATVEDLAAYPSKINYRIFNLDKKELTQAEYLSMLQEDKNCTHTYWTPNP